MSKVEPNQREIVGYSFLDDTKKAEWIRLVHSIAKWVEDNNLSDEVVFHGTSLARAENIMEHGMYPTDVVHAISDGGLHDTGSFWGNVFTASAYAEDTIAERDLTGSPVLLMAYTNELEHDFDLRPDLATLDFPLNGLTKLDDTIVYNNWINNHRTLNWKQSLTDLGAIIVIHDEKLEPEYLRMIKTDSDFKSFCRIHGELCKQGMPKL